MNGPGIAYEMAERDCDIVLAACEACGKDTPPNECELCLSDAYKNCPTVKAAMERDPYGADSTLPETIENVIIQTRLDILIALIEKAGLDVVVSTDGGDRISVAVSGFENAGDLFVMNATITGRTVTAPIKVEGGTIGTDRLFRRDGEE